MMAGWLGSEEIGTYALRVRTGAGATRAFLPAAGGSCS